MFKRRMTRASKLEADLAWQLKAEKIVYEREFRFHPKRKWRFDFSIPGFRRIAVECEGATRWGNHLGRHQTAKGMTSDCEKYNEALLLGWKVLRVTKEQIKSGQAIEWIKRLLAD